MNNENYNEIEIFIKTIPGVRLISHGYYIDGNWWIKINIDISNNISWNVVQELGSILNNLSLNEKLPTVFYPISSPPYLNGGPKDYLNWIIESKDKNFSISALKELLESRLPNPIDDFTQWIN